MSDISDLIQQYKNLSGIFTGAGGDRIPPHGTTHAKNSTDPIPQEIDGIPVDLDGMGTGETIVLDGDGNLVPGAPLGSLVSLQTAYDNGGAIVMDDHDVTINVADGYEFKVRDAGGNPLIDVSDISSVATVLLSADVLTLKDSNTTTPIAIGEVGSPVFNTTAQSIMGAVNETYALLTNHGARHENGGADEISVAGLSGLLADAQTPLAHTFGGASHSADTLSNVNTKISDANLPHDISGGQSIGEALEITNAEYGSDSFRVENRDLTTLKSGSAITETVSEAGRAICDDFFFLNLDSTNLMYKFSRHTSKLVQQSTQTYSNRGMVCFGGKIYHLNSSTFMRVVSIDDIDSFDAVALTGGSIPASSYDADYDRTNGLIVSCTSSTPTLYTIDPTSGFVTIIRALTECTAPHAIKLSPDLSYVYIADVVAGEVYIRKFNYSDGTPVRSSAALNTVGNSPTIIPMGDGLLVIVKGKAFLLDSVFAITWNSDSSIGDTVFAYDGALYGAVASGSTVIPSVCQIPALTTEIPEFEDRSDTEGVLGTKAVVDTDGDQVLVSNTDIVRTVIGVKPLIDNQLGFSVESAETSEPGTPVVGKYYLMGSTSTWFPNTVAYYDTTGWRIYQPKNGDRIFEQERGLYHEYFDGQWVVTVDTVIRGTITVPSGTSIGTWTSSHIQFNDGNPMMLNSDDLMMLECEQKLVSRSGSSRYFMQRSNRISIAPEYQVASYADDVDHGVIEYATMASTYINIDGETTPDKSGILYAELVIDLASSPPQDLVIEYDIRLKGILVADAGTYNC